ncbi:MAG: response regulator [Desulfococcaceae bacterium]|jgi:anti-anti-sigma factor|nr:response regulator [Desulfococcaceae bacterium]
MEKDIFSIKILIVDDFHTTRKAQVQLLHKLGFRNITEADDGKTAMQHIRKKEDIGLIISDWNMPHINGYKLLVWLRANESLPRIPFIMATAQSEQSQADRALGAGADAFITKPFSAGELMSVIRTALKLPEDISEADGTAKRMQARDPRKVCINMAHIQITDHLVLGVLKHLMDTEELKAKYFELNPVCMPGWNPVRRTLEKGEVDGALVLAPLAMDIFHHGNPVRMVFLSHKNGSISVRSSRPDRDRPLRDFFNSRIFYLPHSLSVHHMLADMFMREIGLKLGPVGLQDVNVFFEVVPPVRMPDFLLQNPDACGFIVAEPFGSMAIAAGISEMMFLSGELWENHPCCAVVLREEFIAAHEDAVYEFVQMLAAAGMYMEEHPEAAARIALDFLDPSGSLGLNQKLLCGILTRPGGIRCNDLIPVMEDLDKMQRYMKNTMGIGSIIDPELFVDMRFADCAYPEGQPEKKASRLLGPDRIVSGLIRQNLSRSTQTFARPPAGDIFEITEKDTSLHLRFSSRMQFTDRAVRKARDFLKGLGFQSLSGFNLILRELFINAVEHGNRNRAEKTVSCLIRYTGDNLFRIRVTDEGEGFDYRNLDLHMPDNPEILRKRGYPLIHIHSEKIEFNEKGNEITVWHRIYLETEFDTRKKDGQVIIRPSGDIIAAVIPKFAALLKELVAKGYRCFCFDLTAVREIDSVGLSAFIVLNKQVTGRGEKPELQLINVSPELGRLFRMTNMEKIYTVSESEG